MWHVWDRRELLACIEVDIFEIGITLPGRSEGSLVATMPCRQQLCAVFGSAASELNWSFTTVRAEERVVINDQELYGIYYKSSTFTLRMKP